MQRIQTQGVHHITLNGADRQTSIDFWEGVLGMPFVFEQPNLDDHSVNHLYFDPGDGRMITIFTSEDRKPGGQVRDIKEDAEGQMYKENYGMASARAVAGASPTDSCGWTNQPRVRSSSIKWNTLTSSRVEVNATCEFEMLRPAIRRLSTLRL